MTADIASIIDPDSFAGALRQARGGLVQRLAAQQVELHLLTESPIWDDNERKSAVGQIEKAIADLIWRIGEVDSSLEAFNEAKDIVMLPRAEREKRLSEIQNAKEAEGDSTSKE